MTPATMTWTRLTRRLRDDHNPLRRRSDRVEAWLLPVIVAAFLVLGPLVTGLTIAQVHAANAADYRAGQALHPVPAVLLASAPGPLTRHHRSDTWVVWTPARWTAGGQARRGDIPVGAGTPAGSTVRVWLNRAGQVQLPPLTAATARDRVLVATAVALSALAFVLLLGLSLGRWQLDRRRLRDWAAGWRAIEPQWSSR
jgi:hypothetical protein